MNFDKDENLAEVEIQLNGQTRKVPPETSLVELLRLLNLNSDRVAIELNREIIKKHRWPEIKLRASDVVEIVHFVGGGTS